MGNMWPPQIQCQGIDQSIAMENKNILIRTPRSLRFKSILDNFEIEQILGSGASGNVYEVISVHTRKRLALKVIKKNTLFAHERFETETDILRLLNHPHIVQFHGMLEDNERFGICTDLCVGGTLVARVGAGAHYSERVAATLLRNIVSAIAYAHDHGIVHRDIKLRNIVFETESDRSLPVIIDWGESCYVDDDDVFDDCVGTPVYLSPETARCRMGWELKKSDMWAIGVTAYVMLVGEPPFEGSSVRDCLRSAKNEEPKFPWTISSAAKSFIQACLKKHTGTRVSAEQALEMDFLKFANRQSDVEMGMFMHHRLAKFSEATELQKLLIDIQMRIMPKEDKRVFKTMFNHISSPGKDLDEITPKSLARHLQNVNPYYCEASALERARMIIDATGKTSLNCQSMMRSRIAQKMTRGWHIRQIFEFLDQENFGFVRADNVKSVAKASFRRSLNEAEAQMIENCFYEQFGRTTVRENDFVQSLQLKPNIVSPIFLPGIAENSCEMESESSVE